MHKLSASIAVLEHELSELRLLIERHAGVLLECPTEVLTGRIAEYLEFCHLASAADLLVRLHSRENECDDLVEHLLSGETGFFRHPAALEAFQKVALPDLATRKGATPRQLKLWSAGCASGEEPYSIALSLCELMNGGGGWNVHIVASDIRRKALQAAERGLYLKEELECVPRHLIPPYFARVGTHFLVKPRLRNLVTFTPMNLARPVYIGRFDAIFCMDVLPHFSMSQRITLTQRLQLYLEPGGYLFLGQGERIATTDAYFHCCQHSGYTMYQKPLAAAARMGR